MGVNNTRMRAKSAALALMLALSVPLLGGCVSTIQERASVDLSDAAFFFDVPAPKQDGAVDVEMTATVYFLSEDASALRPVARKISLPSGTSRAQAALTALLAGPKEGEDAYWPQLGAVRSARFLEVSGGVATVDLPAGARMLSQEMLYAVRLAIAATLTEFGEISHVNVLVGGREEGLDLGATLPVGTFTHVDDLAARSRYSRLYEQRQSSDGVTLMTTLYFPTADGRLLLPEVRSMSYAQVSPIEYLYTLLDALGKGTDWPLACQNVPAPMDYIVEMPEIVRTEDGYLAIELQLAGGIDLALRESGLTRAVYAAMLTDTLMGFVPGVEGLKIMIDGEQLTGFSQEETPDGREIVFAQPLATRADFDGFVGAQATLYVMEGDGLARVSAILPQALFYDPRERLCALMAQDGEEDAFALPAGLEREDILAVYAREDVLAVNLSSDFARALSALSPRYERAAVYAMVNTLTEGTEIAHAAFFFEGEQVEALGGALDMRGTFLRNPGMVVNGDGSVGVL